MSQKLQMTFMLDSGKTLSYSLNDPKAGLTKAAVEAVMNQLITKKAIITVNGTPVSIKETLIKSTEEIALA